MELECVQSSHNQALMYEDSGVITRSYPSFITLQKDTSTLLSLLYSLSCYSSLWSFLLPLPHSYSVTHLFLYHFAAQLQHLLHLFISCFVLFFVSLPWSFIWHVMRFKFGLFIPSLVSFINKYRLSDLSVSSNTPFNITLTSPFLSVCQGIGKPPA